MPPEAVDPGFNAAPRNDPPSCWIAGIQPARIAFTPERLLLRIAAISLRCSFRPHIFGPHFGFFPSLRFKLNAASLGSNPPLFSSWEILDAVVFGVNDAARYATSRRALFTMSTKSFFDTLATSLNVAANALMLEVETEAISSNEIMPWYLSPALYVNAMRKAKLVPVLLLEHPPCCLKFASIPKP